MPSFIVFGLIRPGIATQVFRCSTRRSIHSLISLEAVISELYGDKVKREVVKGNQRGGLSFHIFLKNCLKT